MRATQSVNVCVFTVTLLRMHVFLLDKSDNRHPLWLVRVLLARERVVINCDTNPQQLPVYPLNVFRVNMQTTVAVGHGHSPRIESAVVGCCPVSGVHEDAVSDTW